MDEYEVIRRASKLPDQFATRISDRTLKFLRLADEGGEYGELTIELAAALAKNGAPVTAAEQQELLAILVAQHMPTDPIEHLNVVEPAQ